MTTQQLMGYAAIFFGILGSWGTYKQARMIWTNKSAQSVSGVWTITFLAMFAAFLIYGAQQSSFPMQFQGWLRVLFTLPVTLGFFSFGSWKRTHLSLVGLYAVLLATMIWLRPLSSVLFTAFSYAGITSSFIQAYTIRKNRSRGQVAVELQIIYLSAIICWLVYGLTRHDMPLVWVSIGFVLSYASTVVMWFKYPNKT